MAAPTCADTYRATGLPLSGLESASKDFAIDRTEAALKTLHPL